MRTHVKYASSEELAIRHLQRKNQSYEADYFRLRRRLGDKEARLLIIKTAETLKMVGYRITKIPGPPITDPTHPKNWRALNAT